LLRNYLKRFACNGEIIRGLQKLFPILTALLAQALSKNKLMIAMISTTVISDKLSAMSFPFQFPSIFQKEVLVESCF
jgi:hypothetical protein